MENEREEKVNKIQNTIVNSLANIYKIAENIEKVDQEKANWIVKEVEELRKNIANNHTQAVEFLSEIMLIQTEIMNFLDTDNYKQKTLTTQKNEMEEVFASIGKQTISEKDKEALLQNKSEGKEMQIYKPQKKHLWQKILEKIASIFSTQQEA